jgi:hypothetical protein
MTSEHDQHLQLIDPLGKLPNPGHGTGGRGRGWVGRNLFFCLTEQSLHGVVAANG